MGGSAGSESSKILSRRGWAGRGRARRGKAFKKGEKLMSNQLEIPGKLTPISLNLPKKMDFDEWERAGKILGMFGNASGWYIGDWLNYGEHQYGEKYAQAAELTGYEPSTLQGFMYVSARVPIVNRRATLSFAHHREVSPLEPEEQKKWLDLADLNKWSRGELRAKMKGEESTVATESREVYFRFILEWDKDPGEVVKEAVTELCDVYSGRVLKIQTKGLKAEPDEGKD